MRAVFLGGPLKGLRIETSAKKVEVPRRLVPMLGLSLEQTKTEIAAFPERYQIGTYRRLLIPLYVFTGWRAP